MSMPSIVGRSLGIVLLLLGSLGAAGAPHAAPVVWEVTGTVGLTGPATDVPDPLLTSLGIAVGAPYKATITLDPNTPNLGAGQGVGYYPGGVLAMEIEVGSYSVQATRGPALSNLSLTNSQSLVATLQNLSGNDFLTSPLLQLHVSALPGTFATDAFPTQPPSLAQLNPFLTPDNILGTYFLVFGVAPSGGPVVEFWGSIGSWVRVPEPSVLGLSLVAALVARAVIAPRRSAQ